ncbi:Detected protein of unknown function [Hibiscus syriacus]|uniref:Uncharacterized protein n=1 Tax=Hibiscus syriacus TaxID=106335 RepID=A0A6A2WPR2_HIBSY|nr:Detected protein of unknown function [Hibiscus syriacus]
MGRRLLELERPIDEVDEHKEVVVLGMISSVMRFCTKFYELGSLVDCFQGNRKVLLGLHEEFSKLEKDLASSGVHISTPECKEWDEEDEKASKKSKKAKKVTVGSDKKTKKNKDAECSSGDQENVVTLQFEKVATEVGLDDDVASACVLPKVNGAFSKKRKRKKYGWKKISEWGANQSRGCPLPPLSLRIPPSVTPRGSALKEGIPPGPIREMPLMTNKAKPVKKVRKVKKNMHPPVKRTKKLKSKPSK